MCLSCVLTSAAEPLSPAFTKKPTAARAGEKVTIDFTVDRETDVTVYVDDAQGKVVGGIAVTVDVTEARKRRNR